MENTPTTSAVFVTHTFSVELGGVTYDAPSYGLDRALSQYLPASTAALRALVAQRCGTEPTGWDASSCLVVLAALDTAAGNL